ncbi:MAG: uroporphyrinogen-III synthase, partial [Armatimonadetes bacterium]|nr:uroporphyrinogen-III synthase [Armatimonadota bacterium]
TARVLQEAGLRVAFVPSRAVAEGLLDEFPDRVEGRRILIPRAREAREVLPEQWRAAGATVDVVPVYETVPDGEGIALLQQQLERGELDAITFTAASTVKHLLGSVGADALNSVAVICIGPITEQAAQAGGVRVDAVAEEYTIPGLLRRLEQFFAAKQFEGR